jgi:hypothetical protein
MRGHLDIIGHSSVELLNSGIATSRGYAMASKPQVRSI